MFFRISIVHQKQHKVRRTAHKSKACLCSWDFAACVANARQLLSTFCISACLLEAMNNETLYHLAERWFARQSWKPFAFQQSAWRAYLDGSEGLINAPTGSGKTYALLIPIALEGIREKQCGINKTGVRAIWITPMRALATEISGAAERMLKGLELDWKVAVRSGDTSTAERHRQKKNPPELLILTPESLHLLLATKGYPELFRHVQAVVCDEWHELIGSKRGVQVELALSRLRHLAPGLRVWGISATIGNLSEAAQILLGCQTEARDYTLIRAQLPKKIQIQTLLPAEIERFPWTGHIGAQLLGQVSEIVAAHTSTLIFTNTRAQCEIWYQRLLEAVPDLAGRMAMHHSALSKNLRDWVEDSLHRGVLKVVVCTSSLDLGVDFRPVEAVVQIGSPKGVARCLQRAGRSGHQPGALSKLYFAPTHSLEILEAAALRQAIAADDMEVRIPYIRSFDVLAQYLVTLAVSEGFRPEEILPEIRSTFAFSSISDAEWAWMLSFIRTGGPSLDAYEQFNRVERDESGVFRVQSRRIAMQHRLQIGAIVSDPGIQVRFVSGASVGTLEERFISALKPGDVFWFAGRSLEYVRLQDMTVYVRRSNRKDGKVPSWQGGRMPWSAQLGDHLRQTIDLAAREAIHNPELDKLQPLLEIQRRRSRVPAESEFLLEYFQSKEGWHLLFYPFEGRLVHEGMSTLFAWRIAQLCPISFSIAVNDYGFELLSDQAIPIEEALGKGLFSTEALRADIEHSINQVELARRKFRDIAHIAGLVFKGYPGKYKKDRHLQASSRLFFDVFQQYDPDNLLLMQAFEEVHTFQLEEGRLRQALHRIQTQRIQLLRPAKATPFAFPILTDRLRERLSSEKLEDRIRKMRLELIS